CGSSARWEEVASAASPTGPAGTLRGDHHQGTSARPALAVPGAVHPTASGCTLATPASAQPGRHPFPLANMYGSSDRTAAPPKENLSAGPPSCGAHGDQIREITRLRSSPSRWDRCVTTSRACSASKGSKTALMASL